IESQCDKLSLTEGNLRSKLALLKSQLSRKKAALARAEETARLCKADPEDLRCEEDFEGEIFEYKIDIPFLEEDIRELENSLAEVSAALESCVHDRETKLAFLSRNDARYNKTIADLNARRARNKKNI